MQRPLIKGKAAELPLPARAQIPTARSRLQAWGDGRCKARRVMWAIVGQSVSVAVLEPARGDSDACHRRPIVPDQVMNRGLRRGQLNLFSNASNGIGRVDRG